MRNWSCGQARAETLTSDPCRRSYDDIDIGFICMFVSSLGFDRPIDRTDYCVACMRVLCRSICSGEDREVRLWHGRCCHVSLLAGNFLGLKRGILRLQIVKFWCSEALAYSLQRLLTGL